jgi:hypothetical protein
VSENQMIIATHDKQSESGTWHLLKIKKEKIKWVVLDVSGYKYNNIVPTWEIPEEKALEQISNGFYKEIK